MCIRDRSFGFGAMPSVILELEILLMEQADKQNIEIIAPECCMFILMLH